MLNKHENYTKELKDPMLSALLREALDDDPALMDAPGRTDRIMRKVLASGVQPAPRGFRWQPFAWATGSLATAAAAVLVMVSMMGLQVSKGPIAPIGNPSVPVASQPRNPVTTTASVPTTDTAPTVPNTQEKPAQHWIVVNPANPKGASPAASDSKQARPAIKEEPAPSTTVVASTSHTADALYNAGAAAATAGDYEAAYTAYNASYELAPTPDALLASGRALEQLANETLNADESAS